MVEVTKRELDSRALIATKLAQNGLNVILGEKNEILWGCCLGLYPPGVIFDKCAQILDNKKWHILKRKGFVFTSLDEEGLVTQPDYFFSQRFSENAANESALIFCWGRKQADMIRAKYPNAKIVESVIQECPFCIKIRNIGLRMKFLILKRNTKVCSSFHLLIPLKTLMMSPMLGGRKKMKKQRKVCLEYATN